MNIPDPDIDFLPIPDPGYRVKKASDPGSGSATLASTSCKDKERKKTKRERERKGWLPRFCFVSWGRGIQSDERIRVWASLIQCFGSVSGAFLTPESGIRNSFIRIPDPKPYF